MSQRRHSKRRKSRSKRRQSDARKRSKRNQTTNKESLLALLKWFLPDERIFANLKVHGNAKWCGQNLLALALCWAWSESRNLTDAWTEATGCGQAMFAVLSVRTYQGFLKAMVKWTVPFMTLLWPVLHQRMEQIGEEFWRIGGWLPIAVDGSRSTAPRTRGNEAAYCAPNYGKGKRARYGKKKSKGLRRKRNQQSQPQPQEPQAWITMMWHMGLRLPWTWRLGPSNSSERGHVSEMLKDGNFPKKTLFCGDAGFTGYPLWSEILRKRAHFLVRVGGNVSLLQESVHYKQEGNIVFCWPKAMMQSDQPPLKLRLVKVRIQKTTVWLLTSVLAPTSLTSKQLLKLYKLRWGVEVEFRGLKQTLDRAKLRSRNPERLLVELHWSIMAMAIAELFALQAQLSKHSSPSREKNSQPNPAKRSLANTMRALRTCMRQLGEVPAPHRDLATLLRQAVTDSYRRTSSKKARYRPPNPDKKPLGYPKLAKMTPEHKKKLQQLNQSQTA